MRFQEAQALAEHLYEQGEDLRAQGKKNERPPISEMLTLWLTSQYILTTRDIETAPKVEAWKMQRQICTDVMKLRRTEQQAERLQLDRERLELRREALAFKRECAERKCPGRNKNTTAESKPAQKPAPETRHEDKREQLRPEPAHPSRDNRNKEAIAPARRPEIQDHVDHGTDTRQAEPIRQIFGIPRDKFSHPSERKAAA